MALTRRQSLLMIRTQPSTANNTRLDILLQIQLNALLVHIGSEAPATNEVTEPASHPWPQRPWNCGRLFWMKAAGPSRASALAMTMARALSSRAKASASGRPTLA
jgi:hypothetical protein